MVYLNFSSLLFTAAGNGRIPQKSLAKTLFYMLGFAAFTEPRFSNGYQKQKERDLK